MSVFVFCYDMNYVKILWGDSLNLLEPRRRTLCGRRVLRCSSFALSVSSKCSALSYRMSGFDVRCMPVFSCGCAVCHIIVSGGIRTELHFADIGLSVQAGFLLNHFRSGFLWYRQDGFLVSFLFCKVYNRVFVSG